LPAASGFQARKVKKVKTTFCTHVFTESFTSWNRHFLKRERDARTPEKKGAVKKTLKRAGATPLLGACSRPKFRGVTPAHHACCVTAFWPRAGIGANIL
jgi:hypothetical protein